MDILLFDLDAVLLNSAGYHRSLVETVRRVALHLGFGEATLSQAEIDAFEARDITAEWDSSALCAALLLSAAWQENPEVRLPSRPPLETAPRRHAFPDVGAFFRQLDAIPGDDTWSRAERALLDRLDGASASQAEALRSVLRDARTLDRSLTFWLVQLFNLGSRRFESIYGRPPGVETESFLERYDRPTLTSGERDALRAWISAGERCAAIVTNRPCASSATLFDSPEAEIGVEVSGLGDLPFVAAGHLGSAAVGKGLAPQAFLKPSAVHVLAGIRAALGQSSTESVAAAVDLVAGRRIDDRWRSLDGARVFLFEDAPKGLKSALAAREALASHGVRVDLGLCGIATNEEKRRALERVGARAFGSVASALQEVYGAR